MSMFEEVVRRAQIQHAYLSKDPLHACSACLAFPSQSRLPTCSMRTRAPFVFSRNINVRTCWSCVAASTASKVSSSLQSLQDRAGASLGPISLSFADSVDAEGELTDDDLNALVAEEKAKIKSINTMTTSEWREKYEKDGAVDLWVEEEFNSGSRVIVRAAVAQQPPRTH